MVVASMTERAAKPKRLSRRVLRAWAWIAGALAFFSPWAILGISPRPATSASAQQPQRIVIVKKITRRIIIKDSPKPQPVQYVYSGGSSSSVSSAPAPVSTGGSAPPP